MTKVLHHMPLDPAEGIKYCIDNSRQYPHLTKEALKTLNDLKKSKSSSRLKQVVNTKLYDCSLLHYAAEENNPTLCRALLDNGADPGAKDLSGAEPLHLAARHNHIACVRILLEKGANIYALDSLGRTPCKAALDHYKSEAVTVLKLAEIQNENIVPVVVENQSNLERNLSNIQRNLSNIQSNRRDIERNASNIERMQEMLEELKDWRKHGESSVGSTEQGRLADETHLESVRQLQGRVKQLESQVCCKDEDVPCAVPVTGVNDRPEPGIRHQVEQLEKRVTTLEEVIKPMQRVHTEPDEVIRSQLRRHWCLLKEHLHAMHYCDYLYQEEGLEMADLKNIKSKHAESEKTDEMLTRLFEQTGTRWVKPFLTKLREHNLDIFKRVDIHGSV